MKEVGHVASEGGAFQAELAQRLKAETVLACLGNRNHCGQSRISEGENRERAAGDAVRPGLCMAFP